MLNSTKLYQGSSKALLSIYLLAGMLNSTLFVLLVVEEHLVLLCQGSLKATSLLRLF